MNKEERYEIGEFMLELANDIASANEDFRCSTCMDTLDRIESFTRQFVGNDYAQYIEDMIIRLHEGDDEE